MNFLRKSLGGTRGRAYEGKHRKGTARHSGGAHRKGQ